MADSARMDDSERTDGGGGTLTLTTHGLDSREGRARWVHTLWSTYCEMDVSWSRPRARFDAELVVRPFGDLRVTTVRADQHSVVRSPAMIGSDADRDFLLCVVTSGHVEIEQSGRSAVLEQGAFAVLDSAVPFVHRPVTEFEQVVVRTPRELLTSRLPEHALAGLTGRGISGRTGPGGLVSHLLLDIAGMDSAMSPGSAASFSSSVLDMLVTALADQATPGTGAEVARARDLMRVRHALEQRLHDPDYALTDVAAQLGMSVRYIHKLFHATGSTPRAWLYQQRLERARKYLLATDLTVAEASERAGFRDVSHFSRTFRARFGVSPGSYRSRAG